LGYDATITDGVGSGKSEIWGGAIEREKGIMRRGKRGERGEDG